MKEMFLANVHRPHEAKIFIVTAELDPTSFACLDELRRRHFPADHNFLSAHLTMFHQVSLDDAEIVAHMLFPQGPLSAQFAGVRFFGRGVAVDVACAPLIELRETMRRRFKRVSPQDSQPWRPHVTVQNKVMPSVARQLYEELTAGFQARDGQIVGIMLWEYLGGPWSLWKRLSFGSSDYKVAETFRTTGCQTLRRQLARGIQSFPQPAVHRLGLTTGLNKSAARSDLCPIMTQIATERSRGGANVVDSHVGAFEVFISCAGHSHRCLFIASVLKPHCRPL